MNSQKIILLLMASALLTACGTKEDDPDNPSAQRRVPLQISTGIMGSVTRAFDTTWEQGDAIGVFTTPAGNTTSVTKSGASYDDANVPYYTITEEETYVEGAYVYKPFVNAGTQQVYLPADGSDVDVYAYYPRNASVSLSNPLPITVTGTSNPSTPTIPAPQTTAQQKGFDVLSVKASKCADGTNPINIDHPRVNLMFEHIMTKVIVYVMAGDGIQESELSDNNVSSVQLLGQPVSATFAPVTRELAITSGSNTITMQKILYNAENPDPDYVSTYTKYTKYNDATPPVEEWTKNVLHVYRAIVLPTNTTTNPASNTARKIQFNVGQTTYTYTITDAFAPGHEMRFAVRLSASEIQVETVIKNWKSVPINPNALYPDGEDQ